MDTILTCTAASVDVGGAPDVIDILPLGHVKSQKGNFNVDAESFTAMQRQLTARGVDLVVDYEHQTLSGAQAPAAGWVKELLLKETGIAARVEWTDTARRYLENREYRYLSPVISVRKGDGKATGLYSIALTNTPAIDGMTPIINSLRFEEGDTDMDLLKELADLLGLDEDTAPEQIMAAFKTALKAAEKAPAETDMVVANKAVCDALDLPENAAEADVTAKILSLKTGQSGAFDAQTEVLKLKAQLADRDAEEAVTLALKSGKLSAAQRPWAKSYALADPNGFAQFMEKAPQVVPMGELLGEPMALKSKAPDEATLLICKQMGVDPADIAKFGGEGFKTWQH